MRHDHTRRGSAILAALLLALLASAAAIILLAQAANSASLTRHSIEYQRAKIAAEAGLDYGRTELVELLKRYQFVLPAGDVTQLLDAMDGPPELGDGNYVYETPSGRVAFSITAEDAVQSGIIPEGSIAEGQFGQYQYFTITCGAKNTHSGVGSVLRERVLAVSLFLMRFGVFYEGDLEILPGPPMAFEGWVHGNSDVYVGGPLDFLGKLTSHQELHHRRKDTGELEGEVFIQNPSGQLVSMLQHGDVIDSSYNDWMIDALQLWDGQVKSGAHAVPHLAPPINSMDTPHDIIERPLLPAAPGYHKETEAEKLANKAGLRIHVDAAGNVTITDHYGADVTDQFDAAALEHDGAYDGAPLAKKQGNGEYQFETAGIYDVSQRFYDGRENTTIAPVDIYVDELIDAYPELYSGAKYGVTEGRGVVYVTRDDPDGPGGIIPAVRLRNGRHLSAGGLTFASDLPIYIEGDYNTVNGQPALVAGDAVTMLSKAWQDAKSKAGIGTRLAADTAYNTVIMTGNSLTVPGAQYNGGLENVLRFQENWTDRTVRYRGSIIDLWFSEVVTGPWEYGNYYTAPNRDWGYDPIYQSEAPPGIPRVFGLEQLAWTETTWAAAGWN